MKIMAAARTPEPCEPGNFAALTGNLICQTGNVGNLPASFIVILTINEIPDRRQLNLGCETEPEKGVAIPIFVLPTRRTLRAEASDAV
jgi:hypothetical protein